MLIFFPSYLGLNTLVFFYSSQDRPSSLPWSTPLTPLKWYIASSSACNQGTSCSWLCQYRCGEAHCLPILLVGLETALWLGVIPVVPSINIPLVYSFWAIISWRGRWGKTGFDKDQDEIGEGV